MSGWPALLISENELFFWICLHLILIQNLIKFHFIRDCCCSYLNLWNDGTYNVQLMVPNSGHNQITCEGHTECLPGPNSLSGADFQMMNGFLLQQHDFESHPGVWFSYLGDTPGVSTLLFRLARECTHCPYIIPFILLASAGSYGLNCSHLNIILNVQQNTLLLVPIQNL